MLNNLKAFHNPHFLKFDRQVKFSLVHPVQQVETKNNLEFIE